MPSGCYGNRMKPKGGVTGLQHVSIRINPPQNKSESKQPLVELITGQPLSCDCTIDLCAEEYAYAIWLNVYRA